MEALQRIAADQLMLDKVYIGYNNNTLDTHSGLHKQRLTSVSNLEKKYFSRLPRCPFLYLNKRLTSFEFFFKNHRVLAFLMVKSKLVIFVVTKTNTGIKKIPRLIIS